MILASGRGERMRPLSDAIPKPLLRAGGKPLIVWQIEALARAGFRDIVINASHLAGALQAYDERLCREISAVVLRNRGAGPFGLLNLLDERCGGVFEDIDAVIPAAERDAFMSRYKAAAGFAMETLNSAPSIIAPGARVRRE